MHFSLVLIGAHNGSKLAEPIAAARNAGNVLLVEPVPFLFALLEQRYGDDPAIILRNLCISTTDGQVPFVAPLPSANSVISGGDQLGSLLKDHAVNHDARLSSHVETIEVASKTFVSIIDGSGITGIDVLFCDTEGMDVTLLESFPFEKIKPLQILFEFKHADGTHRVGKKLGRFLIRLDDLGYKVKVLDAENLLAEYGPVPGRDGDESKKSEPNKIDRPIRFLIKG